MGISSGCPKLWRLRRVVQIDSAKSTFQRLAGSLHGCPGTCISWTDSNEEEVDHDTRQCRQLGDVHGQPSASQSGTKRERDSRWARGQFGRNSDMAADCSRRLQGIGSGSRASSRTHAELPRVVNMPQNDDVQYPQITQPVYCQPPGSFGHTTVKYVHIRTVFPSSIVGTSTAAAEVAGIPLDRTLHAWSSVGAFTRSNFVPTANNDNHWNRIPPMEYAEPRVTGEKRGNQRREHAEDGRHRRTRTKFDTVNNDWCCPGLTDVWWNLLCPGDCWFGLFPRMYY